MNALFRKRALTKLMSREQLDEPVRNLFLRVSSAVVAVLVTVVLGLVWTFFGRLPEEGQGRGILMSLDSVRPVQSRASGQILQWHVEVGDVVEAGQEIGILDQPQIERELEQAEERLAQVREKNRAVIDLRERATRTERDSLERRRAWLEERAAYLEEFVAHTRDFASTIYEKNLARLDTQRGKLEASREAAVDMSSALGGRLDAYRRLRSERLTSEDAVVDARIRLEDKRLRISDVELEIQRADLTETQLTEVYVDARNLIVDRENMLTDVRLELRELEKREAALDKEASQAEFTDQNEIDELLRTIQLAEERLRLDRIVVTEYGGRILEVTTAVGEIIQPGQRLLQIDTRDPDDELLAIGYFHPKEGKQLHVGMEVDVAPTSVKRNRYGAIRGHVSSITPQPVTAEAVVNTVGNSLLARELTAGGFEIEAYIELEHDPEGASGFEWTSRHGPPGVEVTAGTDVTNWVTLERRRPWSYVIPKLREWMGL